MVAKKKRIVRRRKPKQSKSIISDDIYIPNHSGMLDAGKIHRVPTDDLDPVNKKYADSLVSGATGSFTAGSGETVNVVNGLITAITFINFLILLETGDSILMENADRMENG